MDFSIKEIKLCDYGCGRIAIHKFKNGKYCCSVSHNKCPSCINKNIISNIGKTHTEETKKKIGKKHKGKIISDTQKEKQRISMKGQKWTIERRKKCEEYYKTHDGPMKGKRHTTESKNKMSINTKGYKHTEKTKKKMSENNKGKVFSSITKKKMSISAKKRANRPDSYVKSKINREKLRKKMLNGHAAYMNKFIQNPSKPQRELFNLCNEILPYPIMNYPCLNYSIDIAVPILNLAIEYDGSYWHQDKEYDEKRQKELEKEGWKFIRYVDRLPDIGNLKIDVKKII